MDKTTKELLELMKNSKSYDDYIRANRNDISQSFAKIDRTLSSMLVIKGLKKADVITRSGIETHYAYQIFSGRKTPSRDKVIMLCFGMNLSVDESQQLLKITGYPQLYGKNERDNAILFGLTKMISVIDMNNILFDLGLELLV